MSWDHRTNAIFFDRAAACPHASVHDRIPAPVPSVPWDGRSACRSRPATTRDPGARGRQDEAHHHHQRCLAEGTQIELSTGKLAPIESLGIGQAIFNPYAGKTHSLTIEDTAKGVESAPMVRIRDDAGRTLLMTEMHPIATPDRGMVQARALRSGDLVTTTQGRGKAGRGQPRAVQRQGLQPQGRIAGREG